MAGRIPQAPIDRLRRAAALSVLLCVAFPAPAAGQGGGETPGAERRVAVLGLEAGEGLDAVASSVTRAVRRVASIRRGWRVAAEGSLSVTEAKLTYACLDEDPACWAQVGGALNVEMLVAGAVHAAVDDGIGVTLLVYDVGEVRLVDRLEQVFRRERLDRSVSEAARTLFAPPRAPASPPPRAEPQPPRPAVAPVAGGRPSTSPPPRQAAPMPPPAVAGQPSSRRFLGWGILGAGATLAGVGLLFGLLAQDAASEFALDETPERRAHELKDQGERYAAGANALYGVGAALAVTGAVLLVASPGAEGDAGQGAVRLMPTAGPGAVGLSVGGGL